MSYIIKDNKQKCWLNIDRVVVGCDIITAVEPVYNYKAATEFSTEEIADQMIEQIKSEGQYDVEGYTKENKDALDMAERTTKEEKEKKVEAVESFGNYMPNSEESDEDELSPELFERPDMNTIDKTKAFVIGGWMDWPGGECFIKDIDLVSLENKIKTGKRDADGYLDVDEEDLLDCIDMTDELTDGGLKQAKIFTKQEAEYILNLLNNTILADTENPLLLGENDNFALSMEEYIDEAVNGQNYIVKPCIRF